MIKRLYIKFYLNISSRSIFKKLFNEVIKKLEGKIFKNNRERFDYIEKESIFAGQDTTQF